MNELLGSKLPRLEDRLLLIQLEAAIAETQRLRSIVPVGIPHGTIEVTMTNAGNNEKINGGAVLLRFIPRSNVPDYDLVIYYI